MSLVSFSVVAFIGIFVGTISVPFFHALWITRDLSFLHLMIIWPHHRT
uniref:Uncharacterized protein n=1 Tax=Rhizophora mucronata TaxID=61149 RepID=A0A2P2PEQ2_RHIMU